MIPWADRSAVYVEESRGRVKWLMRGVHMHSNVIANLSL
jgi:hypothetical protein